MPKILSQSGTSLADTYDVEGSIAGVDNLESRDVHLFDEMGGRVFSERLQSFFIRMTTGLILQDTNFDIIAGGVPDSPNRVLAISVLVAGGDRIDRASVSLNDTEGETDMVLFAWNTSSDVGIITRWEELGNLASDLLLVPTAPPNLPALMTRTGPGKSMPDLALRGRSTGFGAGTTECVAIIHICRANPGNPAPGAPSSHGLPLPGW